jgi:hypothetical protein
MTAPAHGFYWQKSVYMSDDMLKKIPKILLFSLLCILLLAGGQNPVPEMGSSVAFGQPPYVYLFPLFLKQEAVTTSTSYYIISLKSSLHYKLGCQLGTRDKNTVGYQNSVAVLAFGYPRCFDNGTYGANLFGYGAVTTNQISTALKQFALGYYTCTGSDHGSNLVIGAGTSNYQGSITPCNTTTKARAHGAAWSGMVRDLNQWAVSQGIFHQVQIFGANDIELGWNSPTWTRAWIAGFEQVPGTFMLHFGDAAGCPYEDRPTWSCGTAAFPHWTVEDVWYVSYGARSALPLPLIYLTNGVHAKQWAYLSRYSVAQHGYRMDFTGVFTQWQACQQYGGCYMIDNTPDQAYQQLDFELRKTPATAQFLPWKTDIRWILQSEISSASASVDEQGDDPADHVIQQEAQRVENILDSYLISTTLRSSLEEKRNTYQSLAEMVAISKSNPAPKGAPFIVAPFEIAEIDFFQGLIDRGEMAGLPYGADVTTVWQAKTETGYLQVGGGALPENEQGGALYIVLVSPDLMTMQARLIEAPEGCGPLAITAESEGLLEIRSIQGCTFIFDTASWQLTPD